MEEFMMLRKHRFFTKLGVLVAVVALSGIIASCGGRSATNTPSAVPTVSPSTPTPTPTTDFIQQRVDKMTLDEKIGQLVLVGLEGTEMQAQTKEMIEKHRVTGFILYKNN
ncbi:MAG: beta-N-acetylhexosaminidase, partial [Paenibacillus sp.]|nr:beta-N-acetylhexosaminidase [Paenibacillus sp.]